MRTSSYFIHDNIIPKLISHCDIYQLSDIKKCILIKYGEQVNVAIDYYENNIENFDKDEFINSLKLSTIPTVLGINRKDYILYLINLIPNVYFSYDKDLETLKVIYDDSNN